MTAAEWEKCVNLPLDVQEGDFQTEVWSDLNKPGNESKMAPFSQWSALLMTRSYRPLFHQYPKGSFEQDS
jgi:hypothetical protein